MWGAKSSEKKRKSREREIFDQLTKLDAFVYQVLWALKSRTCFVYEPSSVHFSPNVYQKQAAQSSFLCVYCCCCCCLFLCIDGETMPIASLANENHFEKMLWTEIINESRVNKKNSGDRHYVVMYITSIVMLTGTIWIESDRSNDTYHWRGVYACILPPSDIHSHVIHKNSVVYIAK